MMSPNRVFEALFCFHRAQQWVSDHVAINRESWGKLASELSKRWTNSKTPNEFDGFARWIGSRPVYMEGYDNRWGDSPFKVFRDGGDLAL